MKKISIAIVTIGLMAGVACGGGSSWSDADKAQLRQGLNIVVAMGGLTQGQADCMSDWLQENYDSIDAANADETNSKAQKNLSDKCHIDSGYFNEDDVEIGDSLTIERETTTTTSNDLFCNEEMSKINVRLSNATLTKESITSLSDNQAKMFVDALVPSIEKSLESIQLCADTIPEMKQLRDPLIALRSALVDYVN